MIIIEMLYNLGILVALSLISGFLSQIIKSKRLHQFAQGLLFGFAAIIGMLNPLVLATGLNFDGRSIMVSVAGLFFGPIAALISAVMTITLRVLIGGDGALTGVIVILVSVLAGSVFHFRQPDKTGISVFKLWLFGLVVHIFMLLSMFAMPDDKISFILKSISLPILIIYPLATALIGKIIINQQRRLKFVELLKESEDKFKLLFNFTPLGLVHFDQNGIIKTCNDVFINIIGSSNEKLIGFNLLEVTDSQIARNVREALNGNNSYYDGMYHSITSSKVIPLKITFAPLKDIPGSVIGALAVVEDVTKQKAAEKEIQDQYEEIQSQSEELQSQNFEYQTINEELERVNREIMQSEKKYRLLTENIHDVVWTLDLETMHFTYVSPSVFRLRGYTPDEIIEAPLEAAMQPEAVDHFMNLIKLRAADFLSGAVDSDKYYTEEIIQPCKNGSQVWTELIASFYINSESGHLELRGVTRDITGRRISENMLQDIVDNNPMAIQIVDVNGYTLKTNAAHDAIFGSYHPADYSIFNDPIIQKQWPADMLTRVTSGEVVHFPPTFYNPRDLDPAYTDSPVWVKVVVFPLKDSSGKPEKFVFMQENVTDRIISEEATRKLQEQLSHSQKMESVGRLAGGVAHDFNNMLSVILGQANLALMKTDKDNPLRHSFEQIINAGNRSADLTRQLLAFARKQTVAPKILDLNQTVSGMLKILKRLIGENIELQWKPQSSIWNVKIDPTQIDQMLANLIVNARDAIKDEGTITVSTSMLEIDQEYTLQDSNFQLGNYVVLEIEDDGCGMTKEVSKQIFEPFFTTKEMGKGTGLGMATVYGIVKQNNGLINVYSEPGIGTNFKIYLPAYPKTAAVTTISNQVEITATGSETILLVEDELTILEVASDMLLTLGYTVYAANSPDEAISLADLHAGEIDLLLTDVIMPKMNGKDLSDHLNSIYPDLKTLFMSGYTADNIDRHGLLGDGIFFMHKPFSIQQLSEKVRNALDA